MTQNKAVHPTDHGFAPFFSDLLVGLRRSVAFQPFHLVPCAGQFGQKSGTEPCVEVQGYVLSVVHYERDRHTPAGHACRVALDHWCRQACGDGWRFWSLGIVDGLPQLQFLAGEAVLLAVHADVLPVLVAVPSPECGDLVHMPTDSGFRRLSLCSTPNEDAA